MSNTKPIMCRECELPASVRVVDAEIELYFVICPVCKIQRFKGRDNLDDLPTLIKCIAFEESPDFSLKDLFPVETRAYPVLQRIQEMLEFDEVFCEGEG